jgi:hypothetical protein
MQGIDFRSAMDVEKPSIWRDRETGAGASGERSIRAARRLAGRLRVISTRSDAVFGEKACQNGDKFANRRLDR